MPPRDVRGSGRRVSVVTRLAVAAAVAVGMALTFFAREGATWPPPSEFTRGDVVVFGTIGLALVVGAVVITRTWWPSLGASVGVTAAFAIHSARGCAARGCDGLWGLGAIALAVASLLIASLVALFVYSVWIRDDPPVLERDGTLRR